MFQRIYDFVLLFREYVVLSGLLLISLTLLAFNDNVQMRHMRAFTTVAFGLVQEQLSLVPRYIGLRSENNRLRNTLVNLTDEVSRLREARLENIRLRRLLGLNESPLYPLTGGKVVGKNLTLLRNTLTLNLGSRDSIREQMPVIGDGGLVGVVSHVADRYSVVRILLNTDFRASAKVQRSRVDGILAWDGRSLLLNNVAKTLDVKVGDVVVTSEYSLTYPSNIRIGIVEEVQEQQGTLFKKVFILPGVDFVKLEEVFVMNYTPDRERLMLERRSSGQSRR
ncbi:MAG: rod shape-determining protein MreC [Bacteroidota bacterium]